MGVVFFRVRHQATIPGLIEINTTMMMTFSMWLRISNSGPNMRLNGGSIKLGKKYPKRIIDATQPMPPKMLKKRNFE